MKEETDRSGKLGRRAFLNTASVSLALMGFPVQAAISNDSGKEFEVAKVGSTNEQPSVFLASDGRVTATVVRPVEPTVLNRMAEERITSFVKRHADFVLPSLKGSTDLSEHSDRNLVVLGTPKSNPLVAKWVEEHRIELEQAGTEGYALRTWSYPNGTCCVLIAANSDKGVFHAVTHLTDFWLKADAGSVAFPAANAEAQPAIPLRGTYNLACWGLTPRNSLADWKKVIDAIAEDHMNFVFFWLAGLFRSKKFPESFIYPETPLTNDDIHVLIKYSQDRGIRFYVGSGVFAWFGQDQIAMYHPEAREVGQPFFCHTLPASRRIVDEYLSELHDTFPEADGMYLEIGCEGDYHCTGPLCQRSLDEFGSKQIGESELSFLREFSEKLWKKNPKLNFFWPIGYPESHRWDVRYYQQIRTRMTDPRYFWMEARQNWQLPDAMGSLRPLNYFSKNTLHWDQYYTMPLLNIRDQARRVVEAGISGYVVAYEPGFATASVYGKRIPFPVDLIPYRLTRFAYREFTWNPNLSWDEFRARVHRRFFAPEMSEDLVDIMITLRDFMRGGPASHPPMVGVNAETLRPRLAAMEAAVNTKKGTAQGTPPEGITLIETCIHDLRAAYHIE
jgi:hypothetical protein